ncbi:MAG: hypothetical protein KKH72_13870 [Alphaproteobacteria bacterium]|nr:hypothetical protein [Alphaproteobacteria bacterium]
MRLALLFLAAPALVFAIGPATAEPLPTNVGDCTTTTISWIGNRLDGAPDSGDAVEYANGGYGVSYDREPGLRAAQVGDEVTLCLTSIPEDCPPGDDRGFIYKATDLRTGQSWELPNAQHMCGGA